MVVNPIGAFLFVLLAANSLGYLLGKAGCIKTV